MDTKQIQSEVHQWITQFEEGYWHPLSILARLTEEVGELAREVNHLYGEKPKKKTETPSDLEMELGDVLFVLACFANTQDISLDKAFVRVMEKYRSRDLNRWTKSEDREE